MANDKMTRREMAVFAAGDIFGGGGQSVLSVLYLIFLTNVLRIEPALAGLAILISKVWDAVIDPMLGVITDNTRTKMGRRRPYILAGGILLIPSMALLWLPVNFSSQIARVLFATASYLLYNTVASIIAVPYSSMSTEVTADFHECNKVNIMRLVFSLASTAICTLLPSLLFEDSIKRNLPFTGTYFILVFGFGILFAVPVILTGLKVRERVPYEDRRSTVSLAAFIKPFHVRAFRKLMQLYLAQAVTLDTVAAVVMYYSLYVIKGMTSTVFLGMFLGVQLLMFPAFSRLVGRVSKTQIYRFGLPLAIAGSLCIAIYPAGWPAWGLYGITVLTALGFAGAQAMSWIIFPDVVDITEMGLMERITGSLSGVMAFVRTISTAVATFLIGNMLSLTGFVLPTDDVPLPAQPQAAILGIRLIMFLPFAILMGYAWFKAKSFRLTPEGSQRIKYFNEKLHNDELDRLSSEERSEYESLKKEFVS
jgi:Na+/melibiose symporter-like transporter